MVLLVDDESDVREGLRLMLEFKGFKVDEAASAAGALELLKSQSYLAVLTDMSMPDMSGDQLVESALALGLPHLKATRYYVLSGSHLEDLPLEQRERLGRLSHGYLGKPFESADLDRLLSQPS
jgi:CheY-like chemotaxis protein